MKSVATFIWKICLVLLVAAWVSMGAVMTVSPRDSQLEFKQWVIGGWAIATAVGLGWPLRFWKTIMIREQIARCVVLAALVCVSGCVGAFMWDSSSRGGGSSRFPFLRWPELTADEQQAGCFFTEWTPGQTVLWTVLDAGGRPTGDNAGGLLELRCPDSSVPLGVRITRSCVYGTPPPPVQNPVKKGVYDKAGLLIGCRR